MSNLTITVLWSRNTTLKSVNVELMDGQRDDM